MTYDREVAGFALAIYIKDLHKWNDGQSIAGNLTNVWQLADDLDVRDRVTSELESLGYHVEDAEVALGVILLAEHYDHDGRVVEQADYDNALTFLLDGA